MSPNGRSNIKRVCRRSIRSIRMNHNDDELRWKYIIPNIVSFLTRLAPIESCWSAPSASKTEEYKVVLWSWYIIIVAHSKRLNRPPWITAKRVKTVFWGSHSRTLLSSWMIAFVILSCTRLQGPICNTQVVFYIRKLWMNFRYESGIVEWEPESKHGHEPILHCSVRNDFGVVGKQGLRVF